EHMVEPGRRRERSYSLTGAERRVDEPAAALAHVQFDGDAARAETTRLLHDPARRHDAGVGHDNPHHVAGLEYRLLLGREDGAHTELLLRHVVCGEVVLGGRLKLL